MITVGTLLNTIEKCDDCPPCTIAHWPGATRGIIKTWDGNWVRTSSERVFTSRMIASTIVPYTVAYIPEGEG